MSGRQISRRAVLRGAGATIALPFLEVTNLARGATSSSGATAPVRLVTLFHPNGVYPQNWDPVGEGHDYQLSRILQPLAPVKQHVTVISNLGTGAKGHVGATSAFLTGTPLHKKAAGRINTPHMGTSLDQFVAERMAGTTSVPSLEVGTEPPRSGGENGLAISFANTVSWRSDSTKVDPEIEPQAVFDRLFGVSKKSRQQLEDDASVLDYVLEDARALHKRGSAADRRKLDEFLTSVREVEARIARNLNPSSLEADWKPLVEPELFRPEAGIPPMRDEHIRQMLELITLALQTDTTRVATFMMAHGFSRQNFTFLEGVKGDHHSISHHKEDPELTEPYTIVSQWYVSQLVELIERMATVQEGNGRTLLDNSMILYGSALKNGNGHTTQNLPILLAGGGAGQLNPGRRIALPDETPLANLHLTLARNMGVEAERFNTSTGTITNL
ncbi:MAG: DUF1552 domain-containing protein [Bryobacterales bacterium]|nr:DUF1552 domain-containing protein [Bryobacterales bacterium]